jgi:asparagine synthase (glutamine-hydrolysing)
LLIGYLDGGVDSLIEQQLSLVLLDETQQRLILMTDPIGLSHLYYAETAHGLIFGNRADFVARHPEVGADIAPQAIYDYIYHHHSPSPQTIYRKVFKLEGGSLLTYQNGRCSVRRYWLPQFEEHFNGGKQQAAQSLKSRLFEAVSRMATDQAHTGAFLSGGLDSSSVAGALARVFPEQAKTFTMGFPVAGYNETEFANLAVKHFKTLHHEYYVTPQDTVDAVPKIAAYCDEPFGNSSALAAYYCALLAKNNGVTRLLAGDGGDELFAGNERYAKQMLFDYFHRLPKPFGAALDGALQALPGVIGNTGLFHKAKRYVQQAKAATPDRLQDYNFLHRHAASELFADDFLPQIDAQAALQRLRDSFDRPQHASELNRMLYMDWKSTLHDNDLVKVNRMCELVGVEVCYPLLDPRIVELSCQIPSHEKLNGQKLRWFYKQAMADFLPPAIINKPKHGFGLPFGIWLRNHQPLQQLAYDAVHSLKQRGWFRAQFLDHAIHMHRSVHAEYYGELVWVLMMLELWLASRTA